MSKGIIAKVKNGTINKCCWKCAEKHREEEPYRGTYTTADKNCDICNKQKCVTSAYKLFGYHKFI